MATAPPYVPPFIDPVAGYVMPGYPSILAALISKYLAIYTSVVYLGTDTAKYQELSITALMAYDVNLAAQLSYNARSLTTAVGADLDSILKLVATTRKASSNSTAPILVTGSPGATITNATVTDQQGYIWALPSIVIFPSGGSVVVGAICQTPGPIMAAAGTITTMSAGRTSGWFSATNPSAAAPGLPVENDSQARARGSLSTALPSQTRLAATIAGIARVVGVTRYATGTPSPDGTTSSVENPTGAVDYFGNPAHSVSMVVEGGADIDVATAIFANRGIGPFTNPNAANNPTGTRSIAVIDPNTQNVTTIGLQRPVYVPIYVTMVLHGLTGYTSATLAAVKAAIVTYLNSLQIGEAVTYSSISAVAQAVMPSILLPQFSITNYTTGTGASPTGTVDIPLLYYQVAQGVDANVNVTEA